MSRKLFNIEAVDDKWRIWANKTLKLYTKDGTPTDLGNETTKENAEYIRQLIQ